MNLLQGWIEMHPFDPFQTHYYEDIPFHKAHSSLELAILFWEHDLLIQLVKESASSELLQSIPFPINFWQVY